MPIDPNTTNKTTLDARPELGRDLADTDVLALHDGADLKKVLASRLKTYISAGSGLRYVALVESPDGSRVEFTVPNTITPLGDWIPQIGGQNYHPDDFTWNLSLKKFTFAEAPEAGVNLTAFGFAV